MKKLFSFIKEYLGYFIYLALALITVFFWIICNQPSPDSYFVDAVVIENYDLAKCYDSSCELRIDEPNNIDTIPGAYLDHVVVFQYELNGEIFTIRKSVSEEYQKSVSIGVVEIFCVKVYYPSKIEIWTTPDDSRWNTSPYFIPGILSVILSIWFISWYCDMMDRHEEEYMHGR